ncbi:hypothetical protein GJW-30_1_04392 [Variibacter gotjawalensis]|uniref:HEPN domain-containing protein n=1 Tax=Variibacter gotjawalensis TaxID=1333996 RepID=A0A0S3Q0V7_9BRAD|nr:hypothetical protein [Variibacter gotjawalensis]NIK47670.1 hypothetical protein [Variibacter gotjawalensis]RZS49568.1 hypothetical protein EV661_2003 [Variibacter gotjawalensis]BAT61830.1 hypothetical protein GJW-30_1_04392 [Variibacter gotjawalensis]
MMITSHRDKIARLNSLRARLDPLEDFELWFWSTMTAGTNAVNAALHHAGLTKEESAFPSQPGVYSVATGDSGNAFRSELRALGDVLHVGRPPVPGTIPPDIAEMMTVMEIIEHYRDPCTRGDMAIDRQTVSACDKAYLRCAALLETRLGGARA